MSSASDVDSISSLSSGASNGSSNGGSLLSNSPYFDTSGEAGVPLQNGAAQKRGRGLSFPPPPRHCAPKSQPTPAAPSMNALHVDTSLTTPPCDRADIYEALNALDDALECDASLKSYRSSLTNSSSSSSGVHSRSSTCGSISSYEHAPFQYSTPPPGASSPPPPPPATLRKPPSYVSASRVDSSPSPSSFSTEFSYHTTSPDITTTATTSPFSPSFNGGNHTSIVPPHTSIVSPRTSYATYQEPPPDDGFPLPPSPMHEFSEAVTPPTSYGDAPSSATPPPTLPKAGQHSTPPSTASSTMNS